TDFGPAALQQHLGTLHGVLIHLETAPLGPDLKPWTEQARWIGAVYESLVQGGMLAIAASKPNPRLRRRLQHAGFAVADHFVPSSPNARKPRMLPIYLARKGKFDS